MTRKQGVKRPAVIARSYRFNQVIGVDVVQIDAAEIGSKLYVLNIVCWGTCCLQWQIIGPSLSAQKAWEAFSEGWLKHYGAPEVLVTDAGTEFKQQFASHLDEIGIYHHVTDSHSPWQNGRTERRGGFVKTLLEKARLATVVTEHSELLLLINESVLAHN